MNCVILCRWGSITGMGTLKNPILSTWNPEAEIQATDLPTFNEWEGQLQCECLIACEFAPSSGVVVYSELIPMMSLYWEVVCNWMRWSMIRGWLFAFISSTVSVFRLQILFRPVNWCWLAEMAARDHFAYFQARGLRFSINHKPSCFVGHGGRPLTPCLIKLWHVNWKLVDI